MKRKISFEYNEYGSLAELEPSDRALMEAAVQARSHAYAPYSGFRVGAAVLMDNGEVVIGNNQENASFPSGLCAERVAVFQAGARFPGIRVKAIAITAQSERKVVALPAAPCGNCRQAIAEYEQRQETGIRILLMGASGPVYECHSISDLLPLGFGPSNLQ